MRCARSAAARARPVRTLQRGARKLAFTDHRLGEGEPAERDGPQAPWIGGREMKGRLAGPPGCGTYPAAGEAGVRERQLTESRERLVSALCGELVEPREFTLYRVPIVA